LWSFVYALHAIFLIAEQLTNFFRPRLSSIKLIEFM
jgi:hypothetical protein